MSIHNFATSSLAGSSAQGGEFYPYLMENSLRFNDDSNSSLTRIFATDGNRKTWTWSAWIKRGNLGTQQRIWATTNGSSQEENIRFEADDTIRWYAHNAGGSAADNDVKTVAVFRDVSAWYHIQIVKDTTESTAANRNKLYVNGVLQSWAGTSYASLNYDGWINASGSDNNHRIGGHAYGGTSQMFDGYMSEVHFIDGQALAPTSFGESIDGIWVPKQISGMTYGTNGFYLPFKQNTSSGASALFTDATSSYVEWANTSYYDIGSSDDFTLEFFMQPSTAEMAQYSYVVGNYVGTSGPHMAVQLYVPGNTIYFYYANGGAYSFAFSSGDIVANQWHHIVFNRVSGTLRMFIDGTQKGSTVTSSTVALDNNNFRVGLAQENGSYAYDGYLSNVRFVVGSAVYSDGASITVPTSTLTNVTNTRLLALTTSTITQDASSNNVTGTTSGSPTISYGSPFTTENFYSDASGNNNHLTAANLSHTDQMIDTPTNNFATLNPLDNYNTGASFSEGNLKWTIGGADGASRSTYVMSAGKWYVEFLSNNDYIGVVSGNASIINMNGTQTVFYAQNGQKRVNGSSSSYGASYVNGDIISIALDLDASPQTVTFYKNNVSQSSINLTDVGSEGYSVSCGSGSGSTNATANFGQDSSFVGIKTAQGNADESGVGDFYYAPPSGYLALCSANLTSTIVDGSEYFNTVLYTGNGGTQSITGVNFESNFTWIKRRDSTNWHMLYDSVRGAGKSLNSNDPTDEFENTTRFTSFDSDGFTVGNDANTNSNTRGYVSWNWKAGGAAVSNTDGSIASQVSANTEAGFSIVSFDTGGNTSGTVGHGLGVQPQLIIGKTRNHDVGWYVQTPLLPATDTLAFDGAAAYNPGYNHWNDTHPTSSVFSVGGYMADHADLTNPSTKIAYCFANVEGYCKVGSYIANNVADGPFVYTGFRPAWLLVKRAIGGTGHWDIFDNKREPFNEMGNQLYASQPNQEANNDHDIDFLSNGFKWRDSSNGINGSGTYIYLAIAEAPFKHSNAR